ncbi:diaminopimelate decarboxylase [Acutalibacter sp. 1XD8-33]|uniref:diaminopimelate decarboxylase n=1 Tax=Acutalibacter sp. 1XD8-33 TaxID=2320081 RepID=UPI000EA2A87A|nr:diaminopimelate decarboxylase [Acutalibacter sp. 1XD8-33]RKJ40442.1 diaminopimelate decarboxylase [Acutalibacter sp. 1XD8-33]
MVYIYSPCLKVNEKGHLSISDCDTIDLAQQYGTPLYVMSEDEIRRVCRSYVESFQEFYGGNGRPIYASKAFCCKEMCRIVSSEGLDIEVVSGGELYTALKAGISGANIHFQGNNKSTAELEFALENNVGDIVVDNFSELEQLGKIAAEKEKVALISLRVKPGIDAHTHEFIRTGQIDSKFGLDLASGEAFQAAKHSLELPGVKLIGLHCHIGSQIMEKLPFVHAAEVMLNLYNQIKQELGVELDHLNLGGGFGIHYTEKDDFIPYHEYMKAVSAVIHEKCTELGLSLPKIYIEPGRSIVGESGITLYTVGNIREILQVRNYVAIDGGMFENPRYALYQSDYTCLIANKAAQPAAYTATIAGKCCESGDLIQEHTLIQPPEEGDILAVLSTGAYNYSMASNYNRNLRPPCIMVSHGQSRVIIKGETYEDLLRNDI